MKVPDGLQNLNEKLLMIEIGRSLRVKIDGLEDLKTPN